MLIRSILSTRSMKLTLAAVTLQQLIVALSTYLLARAAAEVQLGAIPLALSLGVLACVSLPGTIGHYFVSRFTVAAGKEALLDYYLRYTRANFSQVSHWRNPAAKAARHDVVCKTGPDTLHSATLFVVDVAATSLNIVFNTVSVMIVTSAVMGIAIGLAAGLSLFLVHLADAKISNASRAEMNADGALTAHMQKSWDNIVLGNTSFFARWLNSFHSRFTANKDSAILATHAREGAVAVASLATNLIVVGTALITAWMNRDNSALAVGLIVTLPRSLQTVLHLQIVQSYWAQWKSLREKLAVAEAGLLSPEALSLDPFIRRDQISVEANGVRSPLTAGNGFLTLTNGRVTITGNNGAGKSTSLLALKNELGDRAVFIPAHHQLELENQAVMSSGESALAAIREAADSSSEVILLDEWDANLSPENRASQSAWINELARSRLVVEVRHSKDVI